MGFDGTTGAFETEYVSTFADKALAAQAARGGQRGGLGRRPVGKDDDPCFSAPCEMDASRQREDPSLEYQGVKVAFPFETPMAPQDDVSVLCVSRTCFVLPVASVL